MKEKFERPLSAVVFLQLPPPSFFLFFLFFFPQRDSLFRSSCRYVHGVVGRMMEADDGNKNFAFLCFEYVACCYPRLFRGTKI